MIFLSAGHNSQSVTIARDPGAVNKFGVKEGDLTIEFRNLVAHELDLLGARYITDKIEENLKMYLDRIITGDGSVVIEYHFDSAAETASGCTAIVEMDADRLDKAFAKELVDSTAALFGIRNRGVKLENETHVGRLALMRENGIICLVELGFITNPGDLVAYHIKKQQLAKLHAAIILKYERAIP